MLQCVERKIGLPRGIGMAVNGTDAAFFMQFVPFGLELLGFRGRETEGLLRKEIAGAIGNA
jgi:hypothetical protein